MTQYIINRFLQALVTIFAVSIIVFGLARSTGDPAYLMLPPTATNEEIEQMRHILGTDRPIPVQYWTFAKRAVQGDLGDSIRLRQPVTKLLRQRLPNSMRLAGLSMSVALTLAFVFGVTAAIWRNSPVDVGARLLGIIGQSLPSFWVAIVFIEIFSVRLGLLPSSGIGGFNHYILPAAVIGWFATAGMMRLLRAQLIEVLGSEYIKTARAKGLAPPVVIVRHAIRNAVIPVITFAGIYFALLLTGSVVVETVFAWPGVGRLAYEAILFRDFPLIQGVNLLAGAIVVSINLLVDILYGVVDPRIRYSRS
ncbi:MAG: ABC transporter permease [Chloroflexi bacterium]|nr:ABC transporter permease [Chloroflexota bacterium]